MYFIKKIYPFLCICSATLNPQGINWEHEKAKASINYENSVHKVSIESKKKPKTLSGKVTASAGALLTIESILALMAGIGASIEPSTQEIQLPLEATPFYCASIIALMAGGFLYFEGKTNLNQNKLKHADKIKHLQTTASKYKALLQFLEEQESMDTKQIHELKKMKTSIKHDHAAGNLKLVTIYDKPQNTLANIQKGAGVSMAATGTIFGLLSAALKCTDLSNATEDGREDLLSPGAYLTFTGLLLSAGAALYYNGHKQTKTAEHAYQQKILSYTFDYMKYKQKLDTFKAEEE